MFNKNNMVYRLGGSRIILVDLQKFAGHVLRILQVKGLRTMDLIDDTILLYNSKFYVQMYTNLMYLPITTLPQECEEQVPILKN